MEMSLMNCFNSLSKQSSSPIKETKGSSSKTTTSTKPRTITKICFTQIPWLEKHGRIEDFALSKMADLTYHRIASKDKQELFIALCNAVPLYLPGR
jgi:hypothetical protein